ncbi:hypothetical protein BJY04DRAFT_121164 [Aspergillus karnatakaensis]|uniref:uncharacterized protein n=1 Tax=Aspergillus karnatakaensis TaxID=1810916 RepID=UPI003CCCD588
MTYLWISCSAASTSSLSTKNMSSTQNYSLTSICSAISALLDDTEESFLSWRMRTYMIARRPITHLRRFVLTSAFLYVVTSPNAFSYEMLQRELVRRDNIRDEIHNLPADKQEKARQDEVKRQQQWQIHRDRWKAQTSSSPSLFGAQSNSPGPPGDTSTAQKKSRWKRRMRIFGAQS